MIPSLGDILTVVAIVLIGILAWFALSPFETLGWWAGWFGDRIYWPTPPDVEETHPGKTLCYVVFFSGVGRATGETLSYREREFLRRVAEAVPEAVVIDDIFPYATNNVALTEQQWMKSFWRWSLRSKMGSVPLAGYFINIRNIAQILVSADRRYGPIFNQGVAEVIVNGLLRHGYPHEFINGDQAAKAHLPVFIIGYSGAGQTALGSSAYVKEWLNCPTYVISLGGVFGSDPSLLEIDQLFHLVGSRDVTERLGHLAPGRWRVLRTSEWNRAIKQGKVTKVEMGPMRHTGGSGYLDAKSRLASGDAFVDHTTGVVKQIILSELSSNHLIPPQDDLREIGAPAELLSMHNEPTLLPM